MTLIETPVVTDGNPHQIHLFKCNPESFDCPSKYRGVGHIKDITFPGHDTACLNSLLYTLVRKTDINPSGKPVLFIPDTFTMAEQYNFFHYLISSIIHPSPFSKINDFHSVVRP